MQLPPVIKQVDQALTGLPDDALTFILLVIAAFAVFVALSDRPILKAAVAAWFIVP